ncbi:hypothetical protein Pmani_026646 [Petrolisthes manimaculis]|uniref:Uncharacterized protein n=1 Tax=Petrolisthes manimaculis TaxID=1843537 RepID=A0AAE1P385_9EUCA|nr:hypothetical protein Pmani_026646 [Petrolisthes manimaculis]
MLEGREWCGQSRWWGMLWGMNGGGCIDNVTQEGGTDRRTGRVSSGCLPCRLPPVAVKKPCRIQPTPCSLDPLKPTRRPPHRPIVEGQPVLPS